MKKFISVILSVFLLFSISGTAFASETANEPSTKEPITLYAANYKTIETEQGFVVTVDLFCENSKTKGLSIQKGVASFDCRINPTNTGGEVHWRVTLNNGDLVKKVDGELIIKEDWFGPYNPVCANMTVKFSGLGALYYKTDGVEYFTFPEAFDDDKNLIFQWKNFVVTGVTEMYYVINGEQQGEVSDFK